MSARRIHVPATLTADSIERLQAAVMAALESASDRVLVLHGDARTFCLGADLAGVLNDGSIEVQAERFAALLTELINAPKPVIAEVRGQATGGGVGLAAAADLVVASDDATFSLTEMLFGAVPAIIAPMLLRRMNVSRAILWAMSSESWSAADARVAGLVDVCAPAGAVEEATAAWVRRLQRTNPDAVLSFKRHVNQAVPLQAEEGVKLTAERFGDPEVRRRIQAFVEHGIAPWMRVE